MQFDELIVKRASVRKYSEQPVEKATLDQVLKAGSLAPSAKNEQCWKMFAIDDAEIIKGMEPVFNGQKFVSAAPAIIGICVNNDRNMSCGVSARIVDASIAMTYMMLKATDLGLGTCWLGNFNAEEAKKVLGIPDDYILVALAAVGYPAREYHQQPRKDISETTFYNKFN